MNKIFLRDILQRTLQGPLKGRPRASVGALYIGDPTDGPLQRGPYRGAPNSAPVGALYLEAPVRALHPKFD